RAIQPAPRRPLRDPRAGHPRGRGTGHGVRRPGREDVQEPRPRPGPRRPAPRRARRDPGDHHGGGDGLGPRDRLLGRPGEGRRPQSPEHLPGHHREGPGGRRGRVRAGARLRGAQGAGGRRRDRRAHPDPPALRRADRGARSAEPDPRPRRRARPEHRRAEGPRDDAPDGAPPAGLTGARDHRAGDGPSPDAWRMTLATARWAAWRLSSALPKTTMETPDGVRRSAITPAGVRRRTSRHWAGGRAPGPWSTLSTMATDVGSPAAARAWRTGGSGQGPWRGTTISSPMPAGARSPRPRSRWGRGSGRP